MDMLTEDMVTIMDMDTDMLTDTIMVMDTAQICKVYFYILWQTL